MVGVFRRAGGGRSAALLFGLALLAAACTSSPRPAHKTAPAPHAARDAMQTSLVDWKPVATALGRVGVLTGGTVYRVSLPRKDLAVVSQGVAIKTGESLSGYAAFARFHDGTTVMGDLVVTEAELPKVTDALQAAGLSQTAIHKHLLQMSPAIWWTHIHGMGDPVKLAQGVKAALAQTAIPAAKPTALQPRVALNTAGIEGALGRTGTADGGIFKFTVPRREQIEADGHVLPPALGITMAVNFQPLGGNRAAINGDFVMRPDEVQAVIKALRRGGISLVELHNHMLDEQPRLLFMHFWATGDGVTLAKALRPAMDATSLQPAP